jgi:hypothetical protein
MFPLDVLELEFWAKASDPNTRTHARARTMLNFFVNVWFPPEESMKIVDFVCCRPAIRLS